ncbi:MAG: hypothetical protein U9Q39_06475 [Pseudomonadota bacterium]|nr:hypothetical protein [Pseudomonadota bacterium]
MRKSSLILLLAMAFVLTTVVSGFSASVTEPCHECAKGWTYGLKIAYQPCSAPVQGSTDTTCQCGFFDYEMGSQNRDAYCSCMALAGGDGIVTPAEAEACCDRSQWGGYCPTQHVNGVVLKVCDCEEFSSFSSTDSYSLKIEIIEGDGVYFTDSNISFNKMKSVLSLNDTRTYECADRAFDGTCGAPITRTNYVYVSSHAESTSPTTAYCLEPCPDATPWALTYAPINPPGVTQILYPNCSQRTLQDCCFECEEEFMVTAVKTCKATFFQAGLPVLLIDLPTMVYTPADGGASLGDLVRVKVTIVGDGTGEGGDVCIDCQDLCSCIVELGTFTACPCDGDCVYCLPYMAPLESSWWTGIAFTNANPLAAVTVNITFRAAGKSVVVYQTIPKGSVLAVPLADYADQLVSLDPTAPLFASARGADRITVIMGDYNGSQAYGYQAKCGDKTIDPCTCQQ